MKGNKMKKLILMLSVALMLAPAMSTFADEAPAKPKKKLQMKILPMLLLLTVNLPLLSQ